MPTDNKSPSHFARVELGCSPDGERFLDIFALDGGFMENELIPLADLGRAQDQALAFLRACSLSRRDAEEAWRHVLANLDTLDPLSTVAREPGWCGKSFVQPNGVMLYSAM